MIRPEDMTKEETDWFNGYEAGYLMAKKRYDVIIKFLLSEQKSVYEKPKDGYENGTKKDDADSGFCGAV